MDMANWQNYRSTVNGMAAVFTANIEDIEKYHNQGLNQIVELTIPYQGDEDGLPAEPEYEILINRIFKILAQLSALPDVFFAGHFICNHQAKMHFYAKEPKLLQEVLQQIDFVENVTVQEDPNWDIYFDFLMASPLEIKLNATEEVLSLLTEKGRDLADTYLVEHSFHFDEEAKMFPFMDEFSLGQYSFSALKYSSQPLKIDDEELPFFLVKIEQEMPLENNEIFELVQQFEQLALDFGGEYIGWECDDLLSDQTTLN